MAASSDFESLLRGLHSTLVASGTVQTVTDAFSKLETDMDRVRFVLQMPESAPLQQVAGSDPPPSAEASEQLRTDGNACFGRGEHASALRLYTEAAQRAPPTSPQISLALANRSAAHFQLGSYGSCEEDAQLALQHGYPAELRYKLHERVGESRRRRGDGAGAEKAFCAALDAARKASLDARKKKQLLVRLDGLVCRSAADRVKRLLETWQEDGEEQERGNEQEQGQSQGQQDQEKKHAQSEQTLEQQTGQKKRRGDVKNTRPSQPPVTTLPALSYGQSSVLPSTSSAVDVVTSDDKGRMLVANRDLVPGDVVIVEPALCWAALPSSWVTHCYQCCCRLEKPVPCASCASVQFCSEPCRAAAAAQHVLECGLLERLLELDVGPMALLALRLVAAAGPARLRQQRLGCSSRSSGDRDVVPPKHRLEAARCLVGHTGRRSVADLFRRTATAVCLASLLYRRSARETPLAEDTLQNGMSKGDGISQNRTGAVEETSSEDDDLMETAAGLLHYLQSLPCNAHEVSEQVQLNQEVELREVGAAVYPGVSLLNHACDPNVLRVSHGTTCVVRIIRPVAAGDELLDNYGFHWAVHAWSQRQAALSRQYYFDCHCQACAEDWALHDDLPEKEYFLCDLCDAPPMYCYHEKDQRKVEAYAVSKRAYLKALETQRGSDGVTGDLETLVSHLTVMDRVIAKPSLEYNNCQEAVKRHFFAEGNCYQESARTEVDAAVAWKDTVTAETPNCIERLYGKNQESARTEVDAAVTWKDTVTEETPNCIERLYGKNQESTRTEVDAAVTWKDTVTAETPNCIERLYGKNKRVAA